MTLRAGTWLAGFGIGLMAGVLGPASVYQRLGVGLGLLCCGSLLRAKVPRALLFCSGVCWAFLFNPPVLSKNETSLRVTRQAALLPASRVIVAVPDGREFQAKGNVETGDEGTIRCFKRTWFFEACRFRPFFSSDASAQHPVAKVVHWLGAKARTGLGDLDRFERAWLKALILGDEEDLSGALREDFKKTGLYHLLVVSGFHFTVLCRILELVVRGPFQCAYFVGLIKARPWIRLVCFLRLAIVACAFLYGMLVGFQAPCQRALLGFGVTMLEPLFYGRASLWKRLQWTAVLQSIIFPGGFASISNFLSWGAYVFVVAAFAATKGILAKLVATLVLQLKLSVLSCALIGQTSLIGILTNALIAPLFPLVFLGGLTRLFQSDAAWTAFIAHGQSFFVAGVRTVASSGMVGLFTASTRQRWFFFGASLLLFWHALRRLQKSVEGRGSGCYPRDRAS